MDTTKPIQDNKGAYRRSTIKFPYGDLDDAVEITTAIFRKYGKSCTIDQLAAELGYDSVDNGTYRLKLATARLFGVVSKGRGRIEITSFGQRIVDPATQDAARADAFLRIPLYKRIFDEYQGGYLPRDEGLEAFMEQAGVTSKQTGRARQAFQRSGQQAGYFHAGKTRLVAPPVESDQTQEVKVGGPAIEAEEALPVHTASFDDPLIEGLFKRLPEVGQEFSESEQDQWLDLAKLILRNLWSISEQKATYHRVEDERQTEKAPQG